MLPNAILSCDLCSERDVSSVYTVEDMISRIEDMIRMH